MATKRTSSENGAKRGDVLDVVRELLAEGRAADVLAAVAKLVDRNSELEQRLAQVLGRTRKSERAPREQMGLFIDSLEYEAGADESGVVPPEIAAANQKLRDASGIDKSDATNAERKPPRKRQPRIRRPIPAGLPRVDNPIAVPKEQRPCPKCGAERACIDHEVTEVIELVPAKLIVRKDIREKLACRTCEAEVVRAPPGNKVVAGGRLGTTLVSTLVVDKYDDGLPLHRQKARFERMGMSLPISTLADQVTWATDLLRPLWRLAILQALAAKVMHLDGTSLPVLDQDAPGGKRLGALWGYVGDQSVCAYLYASTAKKKGQRPGEWGPEDMLAQRTGFVVADASNLFDESFKRDDLIECGCNMHARRYFVKALDAGDARAALPIAAFQKLYEVEERAKDLPEEERLSLRRQESAPVWEELRKWCETYQPHEPPSSKLGEALRYFLNHHVALARFLENGAVPVDNGIVERLHVRAALTRKNYLFAGSDAGGDRAAIAYTILGCCRLAGVNPVEYLSDVLPRLARRIRIADLAPFMPARWKAERATAAAPAPETAPT